MPNFVLETETHKRTCPVLLKELKMKGLDVLAKNDVPTIKALNNE